MLPTVAAFLRSNLGIPDEDAPDFQGPRPYAPPSSESWDAAQQPTAGAGVSWAPQQYPDNIPNSIPGYPDSGISRARDIPYDPRDADSGPRESGPAPWTPISPNTPPEPPAVAEDSGWLAPPPPPRWDRPDSPVMQQATPQPAYGQVVATPGEPDYVRPRATWESTSTERRAWDEGIEAARTGRNADGSRVLDAYLPEWASDAATRGLGVASALNTVSEGVFSRLDPVFQAGLAVDGIVETEFSPEERERFRDLQARLGKTRGVGAIGDTPMAASLSGGAVPGVGPLTPDEQAEYEALVRKARARYEQIKDSPDAVTHFANESPSKFALSLVMAAGSMGAGAVAKGGATAAATRLGAGARTARAAGYVADVAAQSTTDPTNLVTQPGVDAGIRGVGATVRGLRRLPEAAGNAVQAAGRRVPQGDVSLGSGMVPEESRRFYHGTSTPFERVDPKRFDRNGWFGPAYYITDNAEAASQYSGVTPDLQRAADQRLEHLRRAQAGEDFGFRSSEEAVRQFSRIPAERARTGAHVRPVDVPSNIRLLNVEEPLDNSSVSRVRQALLDMFGDQADLTRLDHDMRTGLDLYGALQMLLVRFSDHTGALGKEGANRVLQAAGFDGVRFSQTLQESLTGRKPKPFNAVAIFPESLNKIRNGFSGEAGGSGFVPHRADLSNAAQGALVGSYGADMMPGSENDTPEGRLKRTAAGAALGVVAGRYARGRGAAARLGSTTGRPSSVQAADEILSRQPSARGAASESRALAIPQPEGITRGPRLADGSDVFAQPNYDDPIVALADDIKWHKIHIERFLEDLNGTGNPRGVPYAREMLPRYQRELADMERQYDELLAGSDRLYREGIPSRSVRSQSPNGGSAELGSGMVPERAPEPRLTVEQIQGRIDRVAELRARARAAGDTQLDADAGEVLAQLSSDLVDAKNARLNLEPRIRSDIGRPLDEFPNTQNRSEQVASSLGEREAVRAPASELSAPIRVQPSTIGRANAVMPFDPASAALGAGAGAELDENGNPVGVDPLRAGAGAAVAGVLNFRRFPGVQKALQASQQRAARMAANGQAPLNPVQWMGELTKSVGYSSMIGPATATVNVFGNLLEPLWAIPKEAVRAALPRSAGGRGNAREFTEMAGGAFYGLSQTGKALVDALAARGRYAGNPDSPMLSERTINPIGHALAVGLEAGGRVFSGAPDAVFGTIARYAGEARRAAQIASDEGHTGAAWKQRVQALLQDVEQQRAGQLVVNPGQADDIIKAGEAYADRQTFRDQLGTVGKDAEALAGRRIPVVGNLIAPFFNTPWNMGVALAERTPVGAVMNRQRGFDKAYDATVGSALLAGLIVGPAAAGQITGSGPDDPEKKQMMQSNGWKPYHTLIGDTYVPNRVFGIYGKLLNAVGDAHDALAYQKKDASPRDMLGDAGKRFGNLLKQEPYIQGLSDLMAAFVDPQSGGVEGYGASLLTRMVPYGATLRTVGTAMDDKERQAERGADVGMAESIKQRAQAGLGMRQDLPVAQDVLGREKQNQTPGLWSVLPRFSPKREDATVQAYLDAGVDISQPKDKLTVDGNEMGLTPSEIRKWQTYRGQVLERYAPGMTSKPWWNNPAARESALKDILREAATVADQRLMRDIGADGLRTRLREAAAKKRAS